ncbi:MAG TPA: TIM barrel protein [Candidatus Bathyarchaeia archaeon]|nr:TIM barrel protein [Candidatus Bathyarchaeia archaeon]
MRLGAPVYGDSSTPENWVASVKAKSYSAAYCPVDRKADDSTVKAYADAAAKANIVIAEVGAWSNPMHKEESARKKALEFCQAQLDLADRIGARCCVNISGSRGEPWDGPDPLNLTQGTFDLIVETTRSIIDAVKPTRTFYSLETMPWMYPDSADSYLALVNAIDRPAFAVHLDPTNLICSPQRYYGNGEIVRECFEKFGPHIRSCHGKDILLQPRLMTHLDEVPAGKGNLDYRVFLRELNKLEPDAPLMLEHLAKEEEYDAAAAHVRSVAEAEGLKFV